MKRIAWRMVMVLATACDGADHAQPIGSSVAISLTSNVPSGEVVARVGPLAISGAFVARIAVSQGVDSRTAAERAAADALFALEANERGIARDLGRIDSATLARALNRELTEEARAKGPVDDEELAALSELHAYDLARPEAWVTVHALVKLDAKSTEADIARAKEVSQAIEAAVRPIAAEAASTTPMNEFAEDQAVTRFLEVANAVDKKGTKILAQALPGLGADGKTIVAGAPRQPFDPDFVRAAIGLRKRGEMASVRSKAGYHVVMLVDRRPERILPAERRREILFDEAVANRKRALEAAILSDIAQKTPIVVERNVDSVLELLQVSP